MNLNQVTIKSKNVSQSLKFYQKLGLRLIVDSSPRYVRLECPNGDSTFSISRAETVNDTSTVLYFEVQDVNEIYSNLSKQGVQFTSKPKNQNWLWYESGLQDPDGHPLIIFSAGKNRKNPPWKVKTKQWFEYLCESPVNLLK
ncbi:MAG: VOC family protein [Marinicella sp.]